MMKTENPKISVIIATKDRENHIIPCIQSIEESFLSFKYHNGEIVVIDNLSSDNTYLRLKQYASKASIPLLFDIERKHGVSAARNRGINLSNGEIVIFIDDDCRISQSYISEVIDYYLTDKSLTMRSGIVLLGDPSDLPLTTKWTEQKKVWTFPVSIIEEGNILGNSLIGCNIMTTREVIKKIGFFDENLGAGTRCKAAEDTDLFYRAYLAGVNLELVTNLIVYHFHGRKDELAAKKLLSGYAIGNGALAFKYLFIYPNFSRHLYWDIKKLFLDMIKNEYSTEKYQLSTRTDVFLKIKGCFIYLYSFIKCVLKI
jgi:glycosyltransferase involved in cell wall biosynthesis